VDASENGSLSFHLEGTYYTLTFSRHGWLAVDLLRYLDDLLEASRPSAAILKLLGYTLQLSRLPPHREATHWVEVDLAKRRLTTNSDLVRRAVDRTPKATDPRPTLERIHQVLDRYDFTVVLHSNRRK
jgi:hypothetical protein